MFRPVKKKQIQEEKYSINLDEIKFKSVAENRIIFSGTIVFHFFEGLTFDAYSLATLMHTCSESGLRQILSGIKMIDGNKLRDIDSSTFSALIEYGNSICSNPSPIPRMGR